MSRLTGILKSFFAGEIPAVTNSYFAGNICFILLVIASIVFIIVKREDLKRGHYLFISFSLILLGLVIYNPLLRRILDRFSSAEDDISVRFWLLCPLWMIIAYAAAAVTMSVKNKVIRYSVIVAAAAVIVITGKTITGLTMYETPATEYKIRPEAVEIADAMNEMELKEQPSLLVFEHEYDAKDNFVRNGTIFYGLKQYTADFMVYPYYYSEEEWNEYLMPDVLWDGQTMSRSYINGILGQYGALYHFNYVAMPDEETFLDKMDYCGYELVGHSGGYYIFALTE